MTALLLVAQLALAQTPAPEAAAETPTETPTWIRVEDILTRADALTRTLQQARPSKTALAPIQQIETQSATLQLRVATEIEEARSVLRRAASFGELEDVRRILTREATTLDDWQATLATEAQRVGVVLDEIEGAEQLWSATRARPEIRDEGPAIMRRVDGAVTALAEATTESRNWRDHVLDVSDRLAQQSDLVDGVLAQLQAAAATEEQSLLQPDAPPMWQRGLGAQIVTELPRVPEELRATAHTTATYIAADARPFAAQALIGVVLLVGFAAIARRARRRLIDTDISAQSIRLLERPYAVALVLTLLLTPLLHPLAPREVRQLLGTLALLPAARIAMHVSDRSILKVFVGLIVLMLVDRVGLALEPLPGLHRATFLAVLLIGLGLALWVARRRPRPENHVWLRRAGRATAVLLGVALLAELGGWTHLAGVLGRGSIACALMGLYLSIAVITVEALVAAAWLTPALRRSQLVERNVTMLHQRIRNVLRCIGAAIWVYLVLLSVGLRGTASDAVNALLQVTLSVGALSLSVGGVLAFIFTLAGAWIVARIVTGVLEVEVYPRAQLPRGLPDALSPLVRYGIYVSGLAFALIAAGVDLSQVTVLVGSLGIGIGLGLQDLVKDFAAGLTILIERRVHVGDTIQIAANNLSGRVRAIGMRSTVVKSWDGSEVVVPNSTLLSGTVTNWTLSDRLCRIEVPIAVAVGTDPERVVALLLEVARSNQAVTAEPAPTVLFTAFGDSTLSFTVRAWTAEGFDRAATVKSALTFNLHDAIAKAGLALPSSEQDVRIASIAADVRGALGGGKS